MATVAKPWAVGDPCPACSGDLKPIPPPTDAQRAAAANRDNPTPVPPTVDSAEAPFIAEHGDLHRCSSCGYQSRVAPAGDEGADAAPARASSSRRTAGARSTSGD
jgi:hypothetical protein